MQEAHGRSQEKGGGGGEEKKGEILFSSKCGGELGGRWQEEIEIKTHTTFFLPFCPPSLGWTQMPKRDAKGLPFLSLFSLASSGLGSSVGAPHLVGIRLQKESGVGCESVGMETEEEGSRHLR